jgi:selenocysteine lyase/cysteine desulfurase
VAALEAAIDFLQMVGIRNIETRVQALTNRAKVELAKLPNVRLKTNLEAGLSGGVVKFRVTNMPTKAAYDTLWEKHRLAIAITPAGDSEGLRFSPHIYNSFEDIDRAVAAVKAL